MCSTTHIWLHLTLLNLFDKHCFCLRIKKLTEMFVAALCGSLSSSALAFSFFRSKFVFISGVVIISFCPKTFFCLLYNYHNYQTQMSRWQTAKGNISWSKLKMMELARWKSIIFPAMMMVSRSEPRNPEILAMCHLLLLLQVTLEFHLLLLL